MSAIFRDSKTTVRILWEEFVRKLRIAFTRFLGALAYCTLAYVSFAPLAVGDDTACDFRCHSLSRAHLFSRAFCARIDACATVCVKPLCPIREATCGRNGQAARLIRDWTISIPASRLSLFIGICSPAGHGRWERQIWNGTLVMIIDDNSQLADVVPFTRDGNADSSLKQDSDYDPGGQGTPRNLFHAHDTVDNENGHRDDDASRNRDGRVKIEVTPDEKAVNDQVVDVLADDHGIFQRGHRLVQIITANKTRGKISRKADAPFIAIIPKPVLREMMTARIRFLARTEKGKSSLLLPIHPPSWCVGAVDGRGNWPQIRHLSGVVTSPVLRADGTVLTVPGYDTQTGLFYDPRGESFVIPERPSHGAALRAVEMLFDVVFDFPFAGPVHKAAWLAYVLTMLARETFDGPAPLLAIDANVRGTGKGLLADLGCLIATGNELARTSNTTENAEWRKRITSLALAGDPAMLIDNVDGILGCAVLDAALTATSWRERITSTSKIPELPLRITWVATGNNIILGADTPRRTYHCRLESDRENPETRTGFRYPDVLGFVRANRSSLASAALTILRAYFVAGCPETAIKPWGSYEAWSRIIRQAVAWCGLPDPAGTREQLVATADTGTTALRQFIAGWEEISQVGGITADEARQRLEGYPDRYRLLRSAIAEIFDTSGGLPTAKSLGMKLRHLRRRTVGGKTVDARPNRDGVMIWSVVSVDHQVTVNPGSAGSAGLEIGGLNGMQ